MLWKGQKTSEISSLLSKPTPNLELLVNQFNNGTPENNNDPDHNISSWKYDIDEMHNVGIPNKNKSLSLFHINACSVHKNLDDLQYLLSCTKNNFDVITTLIICTNWNYCRWHSDIISGNLTTIISDHLPQFVIIPNMFGNTTSNKSNIYERDWSRFDWGNFILGYFSIDWEDLLKIDELNVDNSTQTYLEKISILLDTYAPLLKIDKCKLRFKSKPWITLDLQKSISVKNKLLTKFINMKHPILKEETRIEYKSYRNMFFTLMKKSKQVYYNKHFETNWNVKNTWKSIKSPLLKL